MRAWLKDNPGLVDKWPRSPRTRRSPSRGLLHVARRRPARRIPRSRRTRSTPPAAAARPGRGSERGAPVRSRTESRPRSRRDGPARSPKPRRVTENSAGAERGASERGREPERWATRKAPSGGRGGAPPAPRLDLTLAAVAERSGLSVPFLSQIENERARPSMRSLQRMADALNTTAVELLAAADRDGPHASTSYAPTTTRASRPTPVSARWCGAATRCTPWSSPASGTPAVNSCTTTTS